MSISLHIKEHAVLGVTSGSGDELTTVTAPLVLTGYDISIPVATSSANGYLSSTDWSTFNGKQGALVNSAGLLAALNDETGTGLAVFNNSPTLITPALGTPSALVGTNITGTASGLTAGNVTTNANLTGPITSVGNATTITIDAVKDTHIDWGTGANQVSAVDIPIADGGGIITGTEVETALQENRTAIDLNTTHRGSNGTDHSYIDQDVTSGSTPTFTGTNFTGVPISTGISGLAANVATFLATPSSANLISAVSDETGTGSLVFATTPTLVTPEIGVATGTSLDLGGTTLLASRQITVDTGGVFNISIGSASGDDFTVDTDKFVVEGDTGNVGIGTTGPSARLHSLATTEQLRLGYDASFYNSFTVNSTGQLSIASVGGVSSFVTIHGAGTHLDLGGSAGNDFRIAGDPNGTAGKGIVLKAYNGSSWREMMTVDNVASGEPNVVLAPTNGNVGIGTTGPGSILNVAKSDSTAYATSYETGAPATTPGVQELYLDNPVDGVDNSFAGIFFRAGMTSSGSYNTARIAAVKVGTLLTDLTFMTRGVGGTLSEKMRIDNTGNVGIGTTAPDRKLEINTGAATGGIRLTYNDADGSATTYGEMLVDSSGDLAITATGGDISFGNENLSTTGSITGNSYVVADGGTIGSASDTDVMTIDASGNTTFTVFPITPSAAPDADYEVANKKYVDDNAGGASTALDNLASVQINTTLVSDADSTDDLGTTGAYWANLYADAVHYDKIGTKILSVGTGKDYTTITLAEAAVADDSGYTIEIHPGMYTETVTCSQNNIHFKAIGGPDQVTVTQANNEVFIFGAHTGCTVEGLTISVTAATTTLQNPIEGSGGGTIKNCVISWVSSTADIHGKGIEGIGGEWNIHDNIISATNTSANSDVREIWGMRVEGANNIATIYNNRITVNNSTVGAGHTYGIGMVDNTATTLIATNNHITITSAATTTGRSRGIWSIATNGYILGNKIKCTNSSTGTSAAVAINSAGATTNITGNVIYSAVTTDGDGQWLDCSAGTVNASNNTITGDAGIGTGGTLNLGGNAINGVLQSTDGSAASTGAGTIKMASANPANSAGFLKFTKNDGTVVYVPYFTDETP
uniref:Putative structural protein n=1 Tax=viral metagenome TaxID=1070528 RepID=A0A6M3JB87_9ZZZZ